MLRVLKNKKGDGYIDVVVGVLISTMLMVLTINVFSFLTLKQDMDYFAKELIYSATVNGRTNEMVAIRQTELISEIGFNPTTTWQTSYYDSTAKTVQYGSTITVTLTYNTDVKGFGVFKIPITLTTKHSGLSMKYWK